MRHRVYGKKLGRDKNDRTSLFRGLIRNLLIHQAINTTQTKAKAIKGLIDKLIVAEKKGTTGAKRSIESLLPDVEVRQKLTETAAKYQRNSGFTQIVRLGKRTGDGAMLVRMSLLDESKVRPQDKSKEKTPDLSKASETDDDHFLTE